METIPGQGSDTERKPLNTATTMAAEVSGVSLEGKVAITSRRGERA
jgi:hypothetical protein